MSDADRAERVRETYRLAWWSVDNPHRTLIHEAGHALHGSADRARYTSLQSDSLTIGERTIAGKVSSYASRSPLEFVAEVYTGLKTGKRFSADVVRLYRQLGGPRVEQ